ncbi:DUF5681 domain-containing protein [Ruegeria arenilitoris]|uniref:DUF5681 domain-containing protein n=1 Tax=Ruegeria arenilitoris TaxID=1173585 RepID=UPI00147D32B7|nr:DUF5681 domain-containing protein [Ruegeria arenilitoris]
MSKDKNDDVGYGKPPKAHQFKPGQSGNPKGRPKGSPNLLKLISKHAAKKVAVIEAGTEKKMARMDVVISAMFNKASKGDVPAARLLTNMIALATQMSADEAQTGYSDEDLRVMLAEADWQKMLVDLKEQASDGDY